MIPFQGEAAQQSVAEGRPFAEAVAENETQFAIESPPLSGTKHSLELPTLASAKIPRVNPEAGLGVNSVQQVDVMGMVQVFQDQMNQQIRMQTEQNAALLSAIAGLVNSAQQHHL